MKSRSIINNVSHNYEGIQLISSMGKANVQRILLLLCFHLRRSDFIFRTVDSVLLGKVSRSNIIDIDSCNFVLKKTSEK